MKTTATNLRANLYSYLDKVLESGESLEIERKGQRILIMPEIPPSKLRRLKTRDTLLVNPEEIIHMDWSAQWSPEDNHDT
ncbi:MAG: type II toxin-antitoxin system Phd/YefM family antitoxin [Spirochaetales bacterium]|nr:type II toxin-antitoxin system Phd/YefM family antitoxin [Spirochaetales bacterium]